MKRIKILLLALIISVVYLVNNVSADDNNYVKGNNFPETLTELQDNEPNFTNLNGPNIPFKSVNFSGNRVAAYCTLQQKPTPKTNSCSLITGDREWDDPTKAGVAAIIKAANADNNGMSDNYYYAEEAINLFLHLNDSSNQIPFIIGGYEQDDKVNEYLDIAEAEAEKVSNILASQNKIAKLRHVDTKDPINLADSEQQRAFQVDDVIGDQETFKVSYKIVGWGYDPGKIEVKLFTNVQSVSNPGEEISNITNSDQIKISVNPKVDLSSENIYFTIVINSSASISYDISENYDCGENLQSYTPNAISTKTIDGKDAKRITVYNTPVDYPKLKIIKKNEDGNSNLSGAIFKLTMKPNKTDVTNDFEMVLDPTDINGEVEVDDLLPGYYCITEMVAPSGYIGNRADKRCFTIDESLNVVPDDNEVSSELGENDETLITTTFTNRLSKIRVSKIDTNGNQVSGAKMMLIKQEKVPLTAAHISERFNKVASQYESGELTDTEGIYIWTTDGNAKSFEGLPVGFYYIVELEAPEGYAKNRINFKHIVINSATPDNKEFRIDNRKIVVSISKVDITTKEELPGATLRILDESGNVVKIGNEELVWVSTIEQKKIEGLKPGTYYLEETQAPEGYALMTEKVKFSIDEYGKVTIDQSTDDGSTVIMTNEHTKVYISKQDITTKEELPGAHLQLFNEYGRIMEEWDSTTEPHYIEGLPTGTYTLTETTAPDGYSLNTESVTFTISEDGTITGDTVMYNTPIPDIPNTLSTKSILITLGGVIIISLGIGLYLNGIKKKDQI